MSGAPDVLVVGAGIAGLAAATRLAEAGARPLVLEASKLPGGRARSWTDPATGDVVDNGQHLLMGCYHETLTLLGRTGSLDLVRFQERLRVEFVDIEGEGGTIDCPPLPGRLSLLAGLALYSGLSPADRIGVLRAAREVTSEPGRPDEADETTSAWLARSRQSPAARRNFWDPLVLATLNERPEIASARALRTVMQLGLFGGPKASRLGWARVGLSDLFAGPAEAWMRARGGVLRCSAPVSAVVPSAGGVKVELKTGETLRAGAVVLALPPSALLRVLPERLVTDPALAGAASLSSSPILGVNLWFDRPIVDGSFYALLGTTMQWLFNKEEMLGYGGGCAGTRSNGYVTLVASGARREVERSADDLVRLAVSDLRALFPRTRRARLLRSLVIKEREATISPAAGWDDRRPGTRTREPRLVLAGDWTATGLPATIESAALSGHRAADAALEQLGR